MPTKMIDITVAIDKLEKIGIDNVKAELRERGIDDVAIDRLQPILELRGDNRRKLSALRDVLSGSETGLKGVEELETIFGYVERLGIALAVELDLSLARGLNYYTGAIFEVKANDYAIGSICGGGRYDDLTGIFGMPDTSGVGISFGADRIYDVMVGLELFPEEVNFSTKVLFVNLGADEEAASLGLLRALRDAGVARRDLSRKGQDEEADGVCQPPFDPLRGHRRQRRVGAADGDAQRYAHRRTAAGALRGAGRKFAIERPDCNGVVRRRRSARPRGSVAVV